MISMMNDVDLTDSTQKRLQWDAEDRGYLHSTNDHNQVMKVQDVEEQRYNSKDKYSYYYYYYYYYNWHQQKAATLYNQENDKYSH